MSYPHAALSSKEQAPTRADSSQVSLSEGRLGKRSEHTAEPVVENEARLEEVRFKIKELSDDNTHTQKTSSDGVMTLQGSTPKPYTWAPLEIPTSGFNNVDQAAFLLKFGVYLEQQAAGPRFGRTCAERWNEMVQGTIPQLRQEEPDLHRRGVLGHGSANDGSSGQHAKARSSRHLGGRSPKRRHALEKKNISTL
ncbi:hypothetical protein CC86DRAFT_200381 [Ophiobolus disseminans]|uniref:Uncharacterized protein n=1 Tax=Ophiobolus disseminans TaxID=1469910 RepID=A0A6A7A4U0_9PLEO|nr:hypothetical protein CC86DRAFT_200381 [Ophiobolus disseminans]